MVRELTAEARRLRTRNARPYADNGYFSDNSDRIETGFTMSIVYLPMSFRPSGAKRNAWRNLLRRRTVVPCQGDFSAKSLRDFALRAPLEMTYGGNVLKARNNMFWKCTNRTKQQQFNVSTCRGLHCKPAVPHFSERPFFSTGFQR